MHMSLRLKFILLITLVLSLVFALIAAVLVQNAQSALVSNLNRESRAFAAFSVKPIGDKYVLYKDSGTIRILQEIEKFTALNTNISNVAIATIRGEVVYRQKPEAKVTISEAEAAAFKPQIKNDMAGQHVQIVEPYFDDFGQHQYSVVYDISNTELVTAIKRQELTIFLFSLLGLIISGGLTFSLINFFFLRPIREVSRRALIISSGNYGEQIRLERHDEIGDLASSVNQMAEALKGDISKLQEVDRLKNEFIMITSHNLRTPLTIIKGNIDMLHEAKVTKATREMINAIEMSALSLAVFSEDMLTIASIEAGQNKFALRPEKIGNITDGLSEEFTEMGKMKGVRLHWSVDRPEAVMPLSAMHIRGAIRNLVDNAIKFTDKGGKISVDIITKSPGLTIRVSDTGVGIAPEEIPKLFTKFHRGTSTLTYNYEGTGIGLYATKLIVAAHGGTIQVQSQPDKGSTFTIYLPPSANAAEVSPKPQYGEFGGKNQSPAHPAADTAL